jgi:Zn-dependent protease
MKSQGFTVGRIGGAPVILTWSWILVALILTSAYRPQLERVMDPGQALAVAAGFVLLLFGSVFLHELAHGWAATRRGIGVREYALTFFGGHTAFTRPMPSPGVSAWVAVAGPAANAALAAAFWVAYQALPAGVPGMLAYSAAFANAFVGAFNLVPALPLDGGALLEALAWRISGKRAVGSVVAGWVGVAAGVALMGWGVVRSRQSWSDALWPFLIGVFVAQGAWASVRRGKSTLKADAVTLAGLVRPAAAVPHDAMIAAAIPLLAKVPFGIVTERGNPVGYVDGTALGAVPERLRAETPVDAVMVALPRGAALDSSLTGVDLLTAVAPYAQTAPLLPVLDGRRVVGVVLIGELAERLRG